MKTYLYILTRLTALLALFAGNVPAATSTGNLIQDTEMAGHLFAPAEAGYVPIATRQELAGARNK